MADSKSIEEYRLLVSSFLALLKEKRTDTKTLLVNKEHATLFQRPSSSLKVDRERNKNEGHEAARMPSMVKKESSPLLAQPVELKKLKNMSDKAPSPPQKSSSSIKTSYSEPSPPLPSAKQSLSGAPSIKGDEKERWPISPPKLPHAEPMEDIRELVEQTQPAIVLKKAPPSDSLAKEIQNAWKDKALQANIAILFYKETKEEVVFLKRVAQAIETLQPGALLVQAEELEEKKSWQHLLDSSTLKAVILSQDTLDRLPFLKTFYREFPRTKEHFLSNKPLILLPPLISYFKEPLLKRALWASLCQYLRP